MADKNSICSFCKRKIDLNNYDYWRVNGNLF